MNRKGNGGTCFIVTEINIRNLDAGILRFLAQLFHVGLVHITCSIAQPALRFLGAILHGFRELPVEIIVGKRIYISLQLILAAFVRFTSRKAEYTCGHACHSYA